MKCYLCRSTQSEVAVTYQDWQVLRCRMCGLGWLDPRPEPADLYDKGYFTDHSIMTADTDEQLAAKVASQASRARFVTRFKKSGRLLDVGCASGHFVAAAREQGFDACGLEVSEWAVREGRERLGLSIEQGTIETADFRPGTFDAITMWHVVEHLENPVASLSKVRDWLSPGGVLVIECPNAGSYDAARYGVDWSGWSLPYHLWHFTPDSLKGILWNSGYHVLKLRRTPSKWQKERIRRIPILSALRNPIAACFSGRDMRVVCRPSEAAK